MTFGSPRVGSQAFAEAVDGSARLRHYRVQNEQDFVSRMPYWLPFPGAYKHHGHHVWLNQGGVAWTRNGAIPQASRPVNFMRLPSYLAGTKKGAGADVRVKFHKIGGGAGYSQAIAKWVAADAAGADGAAMAEVRL